MIASIFSVDQTGGVGNRGTLPWRHHPEDMEWFKDLTTHHVVVMGRKTWDDPKMPKPLPMRTCVVATNSSIDSHPRIRTIRGDLNAQILELQEVYPGKNIWIIGGVNLLQQCKNITDYAYVTHRKGSHFSDTRIDLAHYMQGMRITSSRPSTDKMLNFAVYKNIDPFR
jgi:dihydrofolate reductase